MNDLRLFQFRSLVLMTLIGLGLQGCQSKEKSADPAAQAKATWAGQMQTMAQDVQDLLPYLYDREAFQEPKNRTTVQNHLNQFAAAASHVNPEMGRAQLGDDWLREFALTGLTENLNRAAKSYSVGQFEYSRSVAKASLNSCFQCHSTAKNGGTAAWDLDKVQKLKLAPLERADLLVAARKFDQALSYMEQELNSAEFHKTYGFDFESLLRRYLALIVRVENAPDRADRELAKILAAGHAPQYIATQAASWRVSLKAWKKEKKTNPKNATSLFQSVDNRFKKAGQLQTYAKDHSGDVEYLRATALLHDSLKILKSPADQARALYLLGRAYEVLDELGSWNLHETYYEACVNRAAPDALADTCYGRLEASLYMGYSGSSGTHLPVDEYERLKRLKAKLSHANN